MLRQIFLGASAATAAGLLFVNIYNSVVDASNWGANIPTSIEAARAYFVVANPGSFFRVASPINQVLALIALIISWKNKRYIALGSLVLAILADVMTFGFFYPRNEIMFIAPIDNDAISTAWHEWSTVNWFRSVLCLVNTILAFSLLTVAPKKTVS